MLLRHSAYYFLARGLPGLFGFAALAVYTRLLAPDEFGRYALLIAGVGLVNVIVFQWLRLVAARFLQSHASPGPFLGGIQAQFYLLAAAVSLFGLILAFVWPDPVWQRLLALAVPLLVTQAGLELSLVIASARLEPGRYGFMLGSKAVIALIVGALLAWIGLGAAAPVWGLILGQIAALMLFGRYVWRGARPRWPNPNEHRRQLRYGLPLIVTFALAWVISGSDRLLLAWLLDEDAVGYYSAGYDLAFQSLTLLLTIINTAAYPLAVKALEKSGAEQACRQLARNGEVIMAAALAGAAGLVVLAPSILALLIGEDFRPGAAAILPIIAVAAALSGIKAYHFDIAFHLGEQSRTLVWVSGVAAVANIALNVALIPVFGITGAAWATLGAYAMALAMSAVAGRRAFAMPPATPLLVKGGMVALVAALGLGLPSILGVEGLWVLPAGLLLGGLTVLSAAFLLDLGEARRPLVSLVKKTRLIYKD
jgi:O-antigen/teichoic acid export membrane protein